MTDLELALAGDDNDLEAYLENISNAGFRRDLEAMLKQQESRDVRDLKQKIKNAIDSM